MIKGFIKASSALLKLLFHTSLALLKLFLLQKHFGKNFSLTNHVAHQWAKTMIKANHIQLKVQGQIPEGKFILVANHRSYMDIPAILSFVPATFLSKQEIAAWPLIGWGARMVGAIFLDRNYKPSRKEALNQIDSRLKEGISVVLFPEGTTCKAPQIDAFRPGSFYLAAREGYSVVPVSIEYNDLDDAWIDDAGFLGHFINSFKKNNKIIHISFGEPLKNTDGGALKLKAEEFIRHESLKLLNTNNHPKENYGKNGNNEKTTIPHFVSLPSGA